MSIVLAAVDDSVAAGPVLTAALALAPLLAGWPARVAVNRSRGRSLPLSVDSPARRQVLVLHETEYAGAVVSHDDTRTKEAVGTRLSARDARSVEDVAAARCVADLVEVDGRCVHLVLFGLARAR